MKFSIIIVTYNRKKELFECLDSILRSKTSFAFDVHVVFNGDRTFLEKAKLKYPKFHFTYIAQTTPADARNIAIKNATGEYFYFIDDDCQIPRDYFTKIDFNKGWDVLGGPDQTPPDSTNLQKDIGHVLSSPLCMGPTYRRHTKARKYNFDAGEDSLILCNMWFKADLFKIENYKFNAQLFRNEENYLLKELKKSGKFIHYDPNLYVYHQRRENLERLGFAVIKSGECRVQNFALMPEKKELIYLLPLLFLSLFFLMVFIPHSAFLSIFIGYILAIILYSFFKLKALNLRFLFLHFFILSMYSVGIINGLMRSSHLIYNSFKENKSLINESKSK